MVGLETGDAVMINKTIVLIFATVALFEGIYNRFLSAEIVELRKKNSRLVTEADISREALNFQNMKLESYAAQLEAARKNAAVLRAAARERAEAEKRALTEKLKQDGSCENRMELIKKSLEDFYER
jgi:F0F1-type ATP synthase membrane subunit b/b'